jgi:2-keto-3-deoxy-L-rhamnonate aldolase RhmA
LPHYDWVSPHLPASPFQRAVPLPRRIRHPHYGFPDLLRLQSQFPARRIVRPPEAAFVTRLRPVRLAFQPLVSYQINRQLSESRTLLRGRYAPSGRRGNEPISSRAAAFAGLALDRRWLFTNPAKRLLAQIQLVSSARLGNERNLLDSSRTPGVVYDLASHDT